MLIPLYLYEIGVIDKNGAVIGLIVIPAFFANFLAFILLIGFNYGLLFKLVNRISFNVLLNEIKCKAPIFSSQIISALYTTTGPILLNLYGKPDFAGLWLIINRVAIGVGNFAALSVKSSTKDLLLDWNRINGPITEKFSSYFIVYLLFSSVLILPLIFIPQYVNYYLFGDDYQLSLVDRILTIMWTLMPFFSYIVTTFLIYKKQYRNLLFLTGSNLMIYFVLSLPLTMTFGFTGFMFVMVISQIYLFFILYDKAFFCIE
jgi:O-antigen/teichoic acid export membrane protein